MKETNTGKNYDRAIADAHAEDMTDLAWERQGLLPQTISPDIYVLAGIAAVLEYLQANPDTNLIGHPEAPTPPEVKHGNLDK